MLWSESWGLVGVLHISLMTRVWVIGVFGFLLGADVSRDERHEGIVVTLGFVRLD